MAYVEEVFENKGKLYGGHTGKLYEKSETEEINGIRWCKPSANACAVDEIVIEAEANSPAKIKY